MASVSKSATAVVLVGIVVGIRRRSLKCKLLDFNRWVD